MRNGARVAGVDGVGAAGSSSSGGITCTPVGELVSFAIAMPLSFGPGNAACSVMLQLSNTRVGCPSTWPFSTALYATQTYCASGPGADPIGSDCGSSHTIRLRC